MYCMPFKKIVDSYSGTIYFPIDYDIEVLSIHYNYGYFSDSNMGYAHLLEHMLIKINASKLEEICKNGVVFNAVTKEYTTEYTFINLRGGNILEKNQKKIELIFSETEIDKRYEEILCKEKGTITEEFAILERRFSEETAANMVGSRKEIGLFNIENMALVFERYYKTHKSIILKKFKNLKRESEVIQSERKYDFYRNIVIQMNEKEILLKKCDETKVILFFLHICCVSQVSKKWSFEIKEEENCIKVKTIGKISINNKHHILNRYCLLCTSLKFYLEEIGWIVRNELLELDIGKEFFEKWEGIVYEH